MICKNCGNNVNDGEKFCPVCGAKLAEQLFCENCGSRITKGDRFCTNCGSQNPNFDSAYEKVSMEDNASEKDKMAAENENKWSKLDGETNTSSSSNINTTYSTSSSVSALAVCALIFGILGGLVGFILSIIGLSKYKDGTNKNLCLAGLLICIIEWVLIFLLRACVA